MIFDNLFQLMAEKKASDIFITAGTPIHIKIQGHTMPINQQVMDPLMIQRMLHEAITPAQQAVLERERELNLSFGRRDLGNFRVNVFWQRNSMAVVVRYIQSDIPSIGALGLPPVLDDIVLEKRGLVLVVGATGSGKSTTLAAMIDHRNRNRSGHILTIEDPIEYLFKHRKSVVNQREVGIDTLSWGEALRNAMRQAPDCILIGEIRDRETMQAAISYSQTGHLCLATLHANNAYHALNRIVNFFPDDVRQQMLQDLSANLSAVIGQRLVPGLREQLGLGETRKEQLRALRIVVAPVARRLLPGGETQQLEGSFQRYQIGDLAADMHIHTSRSFDSKLAPAHRVISEVGAGIEVLR